MKKYTMKHCLSRIMFDICCESEYPKEFIDDECTFEIYPCDSCKKKIYPECVDTSPEGQERF